METTLETTDTRKRVSTLTPFETTLMHSRESLRTIFDDRNKADALLVEIVNCARKTPALMRCTPESIIHAVVRLASLDLNPAIPAEAYLVPYGTECTLIYGYGGLRKLVLRSPDVVDVFAETVHQNDVFRQAETPIVLPYHQLPPPQNDGTFTPRGRAVGYYAAALLRSGNWRVVVLSKAEVDGHRQRYSAAAQGKFWADNRPDLEGLTNFDKMAMKTCLRELCSPRKLSISAEITQALEGEEAILRQPAAVHQGYDRETGTRTPPPLSAPSEDLLADLVSDLAGDHATLESHLEEERQTPAPQRAQRAAKARVAPSAPSATPPAPPQRAGGEPPLPFDPSESARMDEELASQNA
jgi:phage RecT family recombinase